MKILVIKLRGIGDCLLSTPTIRALREKYPNSLITVLTEEKCADVFKGNSILNEIIKIPSRSDIFYMFKFIKEIRKKKFDMVVDLFCNPRSAIITLLSAAKTRIGMDIRFRKYCYNIRVKGSDTVKYAVESNLDIIRAIGANTDDKSININISEEDKLFARKFLEGTVPIRGQSPKRLIAINPTSSWKTKSWGIEKFAGLSDELIKKYNAYILILWGPGEKKIADRVVSLMRNKAIILPETSLNKLAAFLYYCDLLITNDSSVKHIAVALNIPTLTLFGPTNPVAWHPPNNDKHIALYKNISCRPCDKTECKDIKCMYEILVSDCMRVIENILE